jgi:Tol biopolymer transport system component
MIRSKSTLSLPDALRWASLVAAVVLLFVLLVAGNHLAQASAPAGASQADPSNPAANSVIYLPLVLDSYASWYPRGMIAFERRAEGTEFHDIFLMADDGSGLENLTNYPADDGAPTWSPDGNQIAFASDRVDNGNHALFKIDLRTREVTQLTSGTYDDRWPAWSPNGDQIAFMRTVGQRDIYVMNADGTGQTQLTDWGGGDEFPAWSPDGEWIVFSSERFYAKRDLWIMRPDGSDVQIVLRTDRPSPTDPDLQDEIFPSWGPDGRIYYTFKALDEDEKKRELLYRIWPDGTGREKVFDDSYNRYIASWAPDGECLVFYGWMGGPDKEIWKWCSGFAEPINLTNNEGLSDEFCAWSPVP